MSDGNLHPEGMIDCSNEQYHNGPGISKSRLDAISISPLNYWDQYINPDREPQEYKHCFAVGDGTHKLVLEPGTFEQHYAVGFDKSAFPNALAKTDDLKAALRDMGLPVSGNKQTLTDRLLEGGYEGPILSLLEAEHRKTMGDRQPMPAQDYKHMMAMLKAVNEHHTAGKLLKGAAVEQSFFVYDSAGRLRKCRTDAIKADGQWVLDLKTTDDVSKDGFGKTIARRGYHKQAAWYLDVLKMLYGDDAPKGFAFIAVQKTRPYDVAVHYLTDMDIEIGRKLYERDLEALDTCLENGWWPGSDGGQVIKASLPVWASYEIA